MGEIIFDDGQARVVVVQKQGIPGGGVSQAQLDAHADRTDNPHSVTKTQVSLSNVDNTSDVNKPVSTAQRAAFDDLPIVIEAASMTYTNGVASLVNIGNSGTPRKAYRAPSGSSTVLGFQCRIPALWSAFHIDIYWTRSGTETAAAVSWQPFHQLVAIGGDTTVASSSVVVTPIAPAQHALAVSRLRSDLANTGISAAIHIRRPATDDFTGAVELLAVVLSRAS